MARITGIGGVFFKAEAPTALSDWYVKQLGIQLEGGAGAILEWRGDKATDKGLTVWNLAKHDTDWFSPSQSSFMINYRIDDMAGMLAQLKAGGVAIQKGPEQAENGKFAWIMDPEGNK